MVVHLLSPDDRYDMTYLRNYAVLNIKDRLARIPGVGEVQIWGSGNYAMRVWLNPQKIAERGLTANDVVAAIREQNVQVAAGVIGASPTRSEAHTSELQSLMRISYDVFRFKKKHRTNASHGSIDDSDKE